MKLIINKPKPKQEAEVAKPEPVQQIAKSEAKTETPVEQKPVNKLAALLAKTKPTLADQIAKSAEKPAVDSNLQKSLVPPLAPKMEKYVLVASGDDGIAEEVKLQFAAKMQALLDYMKSPELPNALRQVKEFCDEHKELRGILRAEDLQIFVRAARQSYGFTVVAKADNKAKRKVKEGKQSAMAADVLDVLNSLDFGIL